jgi:acylphosphatase
MNKACRQYKVTGKVQGVFYRRGAQQKALGLGLTGRVFNVGDGSVEVVACGDVEHLERLEEWLWEGPPRAQVEEVESWDVPFKHFTDFLIG